MAPSKAGSAVDDSRQISEAEWQVMRAVWEAAPVTSSALTAALRGSTGWEPTTVKTLLSRLVGKGILGFEARGRTFHYFPLVSEEACIKREMRAFIEKLYGGELHRESGHFLFKGQDDRDYLELLATELESRYEGIAADLRHRLPEKLLVYVHSSRKRLHAALGLLEGPDWLRAGYTWGILHLAPRACFTDLPAEKAAVHSLTLVMVNQVNPAAPYWLQQAISAYEGRWLSAERIAEAVAGRLGSVDLRLMREPGESYLAFKETGSYELASTVAEFVVATAGAGKLASLLRDPSNYVGIFGFSEGEFWDGWRDFANRRYAPGKGKE